MLHLCTFTGIDAKTDLTRVLKISEKYPFLEFAVLYTNNPSDKDARYMSPSIVERIVEFLTWGGVNTAIHFCGSAVMDFLAGDPKVMSAAAKAGRVQLNFKADKSDFSAGAIERIIAARRPQRIITQHFPANYSLNEVISSDNHQVLHDRSGGRGISPETWPESFSNKPTGYAGGLGPSNIAEELSRIRMASGDQICWIDMETGIRENGYFSLDHCEAVAEIASRFVFNDYFARKHLLKGNGK